ncbi:MAG: hypothetical protein V7K38_27530 [Nostoc sp.]|uniref:hypothetical protein n=1 Tax=Nostoc sp. TaxID=1180 RepID=UPI002FF84055
MRYKLRSNTTPVATTEGTSLRVHQPPTALDSPQRTGSPTIPNFVQKSNMIPIYSRLQLGEVQIIVGAQHVVSLPVYFIYLKYAVYVRSERFIAQNKNYQDFSPDYKL